MTDLFFGQIVTLLPGRTDGFLTPAGEAGLAVYDFSWADIRYVLSRTGWGEIDPTPQPDIDSVLSPFTTGGVMDLAGHGITADANGTVTAGTVTFIFDYGIVAMGELVGPGYVISGIEISAVALAAALLTEDEADEMALIAGTLSGDDHIVLSTGNDGFSGRGGNDLIYGGDGADTLLGGSGADTLVGGRGADRMIGGEGADRFVFEQLSDSASTRAEADTIRDFTKGVDRIDLHGIDAASLLGGNNTFAFLGTSGPGVWATGAVWFEQIDAAGTAQDVTLIYLDTDKDAEAEAVIRLSGLIDLTAGDFVL